MACSSMAFNSGSLNSDIAMSSFSAGRAASAGGSTTGATASFATFNNPINSLIGGSSAAAGMDSPASMNLIG